MTSTLRRFLDPESTKLLKAGLLALSLLLVALGVAMNHMLAAAGVLAGSFAVLLQLRSNLHHNKKGLADLKHALNEDSALQSLLGLPGRSHLPWSEFSITPDALQRFVSYIAFSDAKTVVECGAGVSTVVMARHFKTRGYGHLYSVEGDAAWIDYISGLVKQDGNEEFVTFIHAPLKTHTVGSREQLWYDREIVKERLKGLVIEGALVDGPQGNKGRFTRHAFVPFFSDQFSEGVFIMLDDGHRKDETQIAREWGQQLGVEAKYADTRRGQWILTGQKSIVF